MIRVGCKSQPYGLGCRFRARTLVLLPMSASASLEWSGRCHWGITRQNYVNRLGIWNVRGINVTVKREEVVDIFKEGKLELLALMEMKLKGNGEVSWCGVNGIVAEVQEMERAREGMAILLNDVWHSVCW